MGTGSTQAQEHRHGNNMAMGTWARDQHRHGNTGTGSTWAQDQHGHRKTGTGTTWAWEHGHGSNIGTGSTWAQDQHGHGMGTWAQDSSMQQLLDSQGSGGRAPGKLETQCCRNGVSEANLRAEGTGHKLVVDEERQIDYVMSVF